MHTEVRQFLKMTSPMNRILSNILMMLCILCFADQAMSMNNATRFDNNDNNEKIELLIGIS